MTFAELKKYWYSDAYRYSGNVNAKTFLKTLLIYAGFKCSFWMRLCSFLVDKPRLLPFYLLSRLVLQHYIVKYGIEILPRTKIGTGLSIVHFGGIVIHSQAIIGKNLTISQGVTIGESKRGSSKGTPTIGNNVYIAPGARIIGAIKIGNNVAIGANAVVTKDVQDNAVVVGMPGKVISMDGSEGYVSNTDYSS